MMGYEEYRRKGAFTLLEVIVVVCILGVLAVLVFPGLGGAYSQAEKVVCMARLKRLHDAMILKLNDGTGWPQLPSGVTLGSPAEQQWWLEYGSNNLGLTRKDWQCPTYARLGLRDTNVSSAQPHLITYLPTIFDSNPRTPFLMPTMPWFAESGNFHGTGVLCVRADGSVAPSSLPH
jgi:prepilin-type N-terminal cleavage/methylation domain-containing protein